MGTFLDTLFMSDKELSVIHSNRKPLLDQTADFVVQGFFVHYGKDLEVHRFSRHNYCRVDVLLTLKLDLWSDELHGVFVLDGVEVTEIRSQIHRSESLCSPMSLIARWRLLSLVQHDEIVLFVIEELLD